MQIRISYFAALREERGLSEEVIVSEAKTARTLFFELKKMHSFQLSELEVRVAINSKIASWDTPLNEGDSILFIPPVAGG